MICVDLELDEVVTLRVDGHRPSIIVRTPTDRLEEEIPCPSNTESRAGVEGLEWDKGVEGLE